MWSWKSFVLRSLSAAAIVGGISFVLGSSSAAVAASPPDAQLRSNPATTNAWCGSLSSYTSYFWAANEKKWKPTLYVWKGKGRQNPTSVSVKYTNKSNVVVTVPNSTWGVITTAPQVDPENGWVGYHIATRWYDFPQYNTQWDDDWRWKVRGCLP